jgi:hypothetical protein
MMFSGDPAMTTIYAAVVKEGLLLELPEEAQMLHLLPGQTIRVQVDTPNPTAPKPSEMLDIVRFFEENREGRPYTVASDMMALIKEARSGAMYGDESWD